MQGKLRKFRLNRPIGKHTSRPKTKPPGRPKFNIPMPKMSRQMMKGHY